VIVRIGRYSFARSAAELAAEADSQITADLVFQPPTIRLGGREVANMTLSFPRSSQAVERMIQDQIVGERCSVIWDGLTILAGRVNSRLVEDQSVTVSMTG